MDKKERFNLGIKKVFLTAGLFLGLRMGAPRAATDTDPMPTKQKIENVLENAPESGSVQIVNKKANYAPIKLDKYSDIERLFDMSLNIIFAELIIEEVPMKGTYDDYGLYKGFMNTFGTGSTYSPTNINNYDNPEAKWWHLASNPKTFSVKKLSYEDMLRLVIGWGRYRKKTQNPKTLNFEEKPTVLKRMFNNLQGASLRPNEFSALFCAVYNNEGNIKDLCGYVKNNYSNPVACANKIMTWWKNKAANTGTKDRCEFEACVYLNIDNFCESMMNMCTNPTKRSSCVNAKSVVQKVLTKTNYKDWATNAKDSYLKVTYGKQGIKTGDICSAVSGYFVNPLSGIKKSNDSNIKDNGALEKQYKEAKGLYNMRDYKKALEKFLELEKQGKNSADLLNDIAVTYLNLNNYTECVSYCQKVLKTGEKKEYAKACYNAGQAYEKQNNFDKAILNYTKAKEHYENNGISDANPKMDYKKIYESALKNAQIKKDSVLNSTIKAK